MTVKFMRAAAVAMALCAPLPVFAQTVSQPTIIVTGEAEVTAPADMATVTVGVRHDAPTSAEAMDAASMGMQNVLATLEAAAVAPGDVQTGRVNLIPQYGRTMTGQIDYEKIDSYTATVQISFESHDLPRLGGLISDLIAAGANTVNGVNFGLNDPDALTDEARKLAVADARHRAEVYAQAAGRDVGAVLMISETAGVGYQPMFAMAEARMGGPEMDVPLAPGSISVHASITMHFAIAE